MYWFRAEYKDGQVDENGTLISIPSNGPQDPRIRRPKFQQLLPQDQGFCILHDAGEAYSCLTCRNTHPEKFTPFMKRMVDNLSTLCAACIPSAINIALCYSCRTGLPVLYPQIIPPRTIITTTVTVHPTPTSPPENQPDSSNMINPNDVMPNGRKIRTKQKCSSRSISSLSGGEGASTSEKRSLFSEDGETSPPGENWDN